jgi:hypothetical protein
MKDPEKKRKTWEYDRSFPGHLDIGEDVYEGCGMAEI